MEASHADILQAAVERFVAANGRWPRSMDELDPYGIRGFGTTLVTGFGDCAEEELHLRYSHTRGKASVRIPRSSTVIKPIDHSSPEG